MSEKAGDYVKEVLASGMVGEGPKVVEFTNKLKKLFSHDQVIALNSCTSALTLALRLANVEGGNVITTPFTMIATNTAIKDAGATPIFADLEEESVLLSAESVKRKITGSTKAIVITHVGGIPCEMEQFDTLGIPVISDAAHAITTTYHDNHISFWADYTCFSFQSIKQLNTGDGGAIVVQCEEEFERAKKLKWFGMSREVPDGMTRLEFQMTQDVAEWGYKFHMNDISASIGLANFELLKKITKTQRENADYYRKHLTNLPVIPKDCEPSWWAFPIFVDNREKFIRKMTEKGIEVSPMWRRNDEYSCFTKADLPNMKAIQDRVVFIPVGWWVTPEDREYIVESICG